MRILVYLEPFPIRGVFTNFGWVGPEFVQMALRANDGIKGWAERFTLKIFANPQTCAFIRQRAKDPRVDELLLTFDEVAARENDGFGTEWDDAARDNWTKLLIGDGNDFAIYRNALDRLYSAQFPFDVLVTWSNNSIARIFCEEKGIGYAAMEFGFTRPPFMSSVVVEACGVNGLAYSAKCSIEDLRSAGVPEHDFIYHQLSYYADLSARPFERGRQLPEDPNLREIFLRERKVALVPLQLSDDSNVLVFSPYKSVCEFIEDVVPDLIAAGYYVIIKDHPSSQNNEFNKNSSAFAKESAERKFDNLRYSWMEGANNQNDYIYTLKNVNIIVTMNSSVGYEGMFFGKIVVVKGQAPYNIQGLTPSLGEALSWNDSPPEYYLSGLRLALTYFNEAILSSRTGIFEPDNFVRRVIGTSELYRRYKDSPAEYIRATYDSFGRESFVRRMTASSNHPDGNTGISKPGASRKAEAAPAYAAGTLVAVGASPHQAPSAIGGGEGAVSPPRIVVPNEIRHLATFQCRVSIQRPSNTYFMLEKLKLDRAAKVTFAEINFADLDAGGRRVTGKFELTVADRSRPLSVLLFTGDGYVGRLAITRWRAGREAAFEGELDAQPLAELIAVIVCKGGRAVIAPFSATRDITGETATDSKLQAISADSSRPSRGARREKTLTRRGA